MPKFININNKELIDINEIQNIERKLFNLCDSSFIERSLVVGEENKLVDSKVFTLATVTLKNGRTVDVEAVFYSEDTPNYYVNSEWLNFINCFDHETYNGKEGVS